jgi:peptidoglycan hydrolase CwlO-like protein
MYLTQIGVSLIIAAAIFAAVLIILKRSALAASGFFFVAILAGGTIANINRISKAAASAPGSATVDVDFIQNAVTTVQNKAAQVTADTAEVRDPKSQVQTLADKITEANRLVAENETDVLNMRNSIRAACKALFEQFVYLGHYNITFCASAHFRADECRTRSTGWLRF